MIIRLTENDIHNMVLNTVRHILSERKRPTKLDISDYTSQNSGMDSMPPMDDMAQPPMPPMDNSQQPPMDDPNAMGDDPMAGGEEPPMDENEPQPNEGGDSEINNIINQLDDSKKEAVKKYAQSMLNDNDNDGIDDNGENNLGGDPIMGGTDPNAMGTSPTQQMQEAFMREMNIALSDRQEPRGNKKIAKNRKSPWIFR